METDAIYEEKVTSPKTSALFLVLALVFLILSAWRVIHRGIDFLAIFFFALFSFFSFYFLDHPRLVVRLKERRGLVQDIAFSTRHPEQLLARIHRTASSRQAE